MKEFGKKWLARAAGASVSGASAVPIPERLVTRHVRTELVIVPLVMIVIYAFIPILANGFVLWDDDKNFLENPYFRGLGEAQLKWAWTTFWVGAYQPLAWMLFEIQYVLCGLDPWGYHLTSLVFQVANAVVLYFLTMAFLARCRRDRCPVSPWACSLSAGLATALFAVHPLRVEAVAWLSAQMYLPCILFSMLSVLAYLRAFSRDSSRRRGWLVGSLLLFVVALLFHALPVGLPVVLLILDVYPLRRFEDGPVRWSGAPLRNALWEKVPFVVTSLIFMGLAIAAKPRSRFPVHHEDPLAAIARACYSIWFYIIKTVLPQNLTVVYPIPREFDWLALPFASSIVATLVTTAALFLVRGRWPGLLAGWLSYLVILAPNSGLIRVNDQIAADRYSYMSMLGFVILAAAGFCRLLGTSPRRYPGVIIGVVGVGLGAILGLTATTRSQCRTWYDAERLWTHALTHGAHSSYLAHSVIGNLYNKKGSYDAAAAHFAESLRLNPRFAEAHNNLGTILSRQRNYADAVAHFTEALRIDPEIGQTHCNLGLVFFRLGKHRAAKAELALAIRLEPEDPNAYNAIALLLAACPDATVRDGKEAVAFATRACELTRWNNPVILDTLAAAQAETADFDAAVSSQKRAVERLTDQRQVSDFRSRLVLYQSKKPYRLPSPERDP